MKKLLIYLVSFTCLTSCLKKKSDFTGEEVTITGRVTYSCEDSSVIRNKRLVLADGSFQDLKYFYTDSNGYFSVTTNGTYADQIISNDGIRELYLGAFCSASRNIGTIFLNPCAKMIVHYDTAGHKKNYSKPFGVAYDTIIPKKNIASLSKPDSVYYNNRIVFAGSKLFSTFVFDEINYVSAPSNEPLNPSYTWQHYTVKVP